MGLMQRIFGLEHRAAPDVGPFGQAIFTGGANDSGVTVNELTALAASSVYACCQIIGNAVASLPVHVHQKPDGAKQYAHPIARLLSAEPNEFMTAAVFRETMMLNLLLYGNGYAYIDRDETGVPIALYPLMSDRTRPVRQGGLQFYVTLLGSGQHTLTPDQVFHVLNFSLDGINGISPIQQAKQNIGLSLAMEKFAAKLFSNGGNIGGILKTPPMKPDALKAFVASWKTRYTGLENSFKVAMLPDGFDFKQTTLDPEKGQMNQARIHQVREVARIYRVPPHMLGDLEKASYASIEQQSMDFLQNCIGPHVVKLEQEANRKLLLEREKPTLEVKLNLDAQLRASTQERYNAHATAINAGFLSVNEARAKENLPPVQGGDILRWPLNSAPVGQQGPTTRDDNSTRSLIEDTARRLLTKESKALARAAKRLTGKPDELRAWVDDFYTKHIPLVVRTIAPALKVAGLEVTADAYAQRHCEDSKRSILETVKTGATVDDLTDEWTDIRPGDIATQLLTKKE